MEKSKFLESFSYGLSALLYISVVSMLFAISIVVPIIAVNFLWFIPGFILAAIGILKDKKKGIALTIIYFSLFLWAVVSFVGMIH